MPLSYQPFADVPELEPITREIDRDERMNISEKERVLSALGGAGMIATAFVREGWARWVLLALGAACLGRAWTGYCPVNARLKIDGRHPLGREVEKREEDIENALSAY